ncbi:hypothetical protein BG011_008069 [Mortierella polycephala]|uniref:Uncharacterized protein n=1 Tax=Mortierella polycephala TaxID=41804 RepID=A0A9P6TXZ1_9FUNG|nr:hypothetical protein BG011_008069 [Mortierella polycephala]
MSKDTNAQESLGANFKRTIPKVMTLYEAMDHTRLYMGVKRDYEAVLRGETLRYGRVQDDEDLEDTSKRNPKKRSRRTKYVNDGRAPDTAKALRSTGPGRKTGSRNKRPRIGDEHSWDTFRIPCDILYEGFRATNTCPLDTTLMVWHIAYRYAKASLPVDIRNTEAGQVLQDVVDESKALNYGKAH